MGFYKRRIPHIKEGYHILSVERINSTGKPKAKTMFLIIKYWELQRNSSILAFNNPLRTLVADSGEDKMIHSHLKESIWQINYKPRKEHYRTKGNSLR